MAIQKQNMVEVKIKKYYGGYVIGECYTCGKQFQDHLKPQQGYNHARQTGHRVQIEKNIVFHYN